MSISTLQHTQNILSCLFKLEKGIGMSVVVEKYSDVLLKEFYLGTDKSTVLRATNGWRNKWNIGDKVIGYRMNSYGHLGVHVPRTRATINQAELVLLLNGITLKDGEVIDHIDGNPTNNSLNNLRVTTQAINAKNGSIRSNNTSGYNGINWNNASSSYVVRLYIDGKRKYLGQRTTLEEAVTLRDSYNQVRYTNGFTERHGEERATTIPKGSTLQAIGSGSA